MASVEKHVITPEVIKEIEVALANGENWIVYNSNPYFLEKGDVFCFKNEYEAKEFAHQTISDWDLMNVFHAGSIGDVYKEITSHEMDKPLGENLSRSKMDIGKRQNNSGKSKVASTAVEGSRPNLKTKLKDSLLPKKSNSGRRGLRTP